jgi:hypothetical protein
MHDVQTIKIIQSAFTLVGAARTKATIALRDAEREVEQAVSHVEQTERAHVAALAYAADCQMRVHVCRSRLLGVA